MVDGLRVTSLATLQFSTFLLRTMEFDSQPCPSRVSPLIWVDPAERRQRRPRNDEERTETKQKSTTERSKCEVDLEERSRCDSVRVGAPTVRLGSEARFQVKKSACFKCHERYHE